MTFVKGYDPRRAVPAARKGPRAPRRATILARAHLQAHGEELARNLLALTKDPPADEKPCPMCGRGMLRNDDTKLRAIIAAMDRAGIGPKIEVELQSATDWIEYLTDEELDQLHQLRMTAHDRMPSEDVVIDVTALPEASA